MNKMAAMLSKTIGNWNKMAGNLKCTKWRVLAAALLGLDRREEVLSRRRWANLLKMAGNLKIQNGGY